jgi:ADP-ribose pyrophosphatase
MWKKISSKVIFEHSRLTLVEDEVELPSGDKVTYLKYKGGGGAATIIARKGNKILLQKEYSYPPNKMLLQFPGGSVDTNKDLREEANRELAEESGYRAKNLNLIGKFLMNNRRSDVYMYVFFAEKLEESSLEDDLEEDIENVWFTEKEIDGLIKSGEFENSYSLAAWSLYKVHKRSS